MAPSTTLLVQRLHRAIVGPRVADVECGTGGAAVGIAERAQQWHKVRIQRILGYGIICSTPIDSPTIGMPRLGSSMQSRSRTKSDHHKLRRILNSQAFGRLRGAAAKAVRQLQEGQRINGRRTTAAESRRVG